jgi:glycosyltransferase involved in cell wall biosynthesis
MELGGYSKNHPFIRIMQCAEDFAYRTADFVVSILPKTLDHMISRGLSPGKFCYIPNGIVVKEWEGSQMDNVHRELLNELRKTYKTLVGYVGGHSISNALDNLLTAASFARSGEPGLAFVLIGNGTDKPRLMDLAKAQNLSNVFFLDAVPKKSIPALLADLDILYIGWHDNPLYRFGISPNKLMDYMMAGKPIVHAVNAANDFVAESGCGISVEPDDPGAVVAALREISTWTETERRAAGTRGKEFVLKNHNYEVLAQKFIDFAQGKNPK